MKHGLWFALHATPVKNMDRSSGYIATEYNLTAQDCPNYCDCGQGGSGLVSKVITNPIGDFNILMKKSDDKSTKVIITASFKADLETRNAGRDNPLVSVETLNCNSTGLLEKEILAYIPK